MSDNLNQGVSSQASAIQETFTATEQVTAMINRNSDSSDMARNKAQASETETTSAKEAVNNVLVSIEKFQTANTEMAQYLDHSTQEISEMVKLIRDIGDRTRVINDIVFQTKLLSFNASVEAARAGESGKGFAVVAEEVGILARTSGEAAEGIERLLQESIARAESIVSKTKSNVEQIIRLSENRTAQGREAALHCEKVLLSIAEKSLEMSQMVREIAEASKEQGAGMREISKAMSEIDLATQENSRASEICSKSAQDLRSESEVTEAHVQELLKMILGTRPQTV